MWQLVPFRLKDGATGLGVMACNSSSVWLPSGTHHFAAGLQRQSQHPDVYVQLIAQATKRGRRDTRVSGARLIAEHHSQPLENPVDGRDSQ